MWIVTLPSVPRFPCSDVRKASAVEMHSACTSLQQSNWTRAAATPAADVKVWS